MRATADRVQETGMGIDVGMGKDVGMGCRLWSGRISMIADMLENRAAHYQDVDIFTLSICKHHNNKVHINGGGVETIHWYLFSLAQLFMTEMRIYY